MRVMLLLTALLSVAVAGSASATLPGANGRVAFVKQFDYCYFYASLPPQARKADCLVEPKLSIALIRRRGSRPRHLTSGYAPSFSPTGRRLAFQTAGGAIAVRNAYRSGSAVRVARGDAADPSWSPSGARLAYSRILRDSEVSTWVFSVQRDGSDQRRLAPGQHPDWASDGRIAFDRDPGTLGAPAVTSVYVMGPFGEAPHRLASGAQPSWSPHGHLIAFTRPVKGRNQVFVMRSDGSGVKRITGGRFAHQQPAWSPTGGRLVCVRSSTLRDALVTMRPDGSHPHVLYRGRQAADTDADTGRLSLLDPAWQPQGRH